MSITLPRRYWDAACLTLGATLDLALPPRCLSCREPVPFAGGLCPACWAAMPFAAGPVCRICALPLPTALANSCNQHQESSIDRPEGPPQRICESCAFEPPAWERAAAALSYSGLARRLILRFKHGDRIEGARLLSKWLATAATPLLRPDTLILPVPLHPWRLIGRGYNQSALLARHMSRELGAACDVFALERTRATPSQQRLKAKARLRNVRPEDFALRRSDDVAGRPVLLVDDVLTTGTTLNACAIALQRAGAIHVDVAVLARVVQGANETI